MHCPSCGSMSSGNQQFCRLCGLDLEKISQFLSEQLSATPSELDEKRRMLERTGSYLLTGSLAFLYVAICWVIIDQIIIGGGQALAGIALLIIFTGLGLGGLLKSYSSFLRRHGNESGSRTLTAMPPSNGATELTSDSGNQSIASVTERTTELLKVRARAAPRRF